MKHYFITALIIFTQAQGITKLSDREKFKTLQKKILVLVNDYNEKKKEPPLEQVKTVEQSLRSLTESSNKQVALQAIITYSLIKKLLERYAN